MKKKSFVLNIGVAGDYDAYCNTLNRNRTCVGINFPFKCLKNCTVKWV